MSDKDRQAAYQRDHYRRKPAYYKSKAKERKAALIRLLAEYKASLSCIKCGESHPACLDFHHKRDKTVCISRAPKLGWSWKRMMIEIAKCDVLCANCHRKLHFGAASGEELVLIRPAGEINTALRHQSMPTMLDGNEHADCESVGRGSNPQVGTNMRE